MISPYGILDGIVQGNGSNAIALNFHQSTQALSSLYPPVPMKITLDIPKVADLLPDLDLNLLCEYINPSEEPQMLRGYPQALR